MDHPDLVSYKIFEEIILSTFYLKEVEVEAVVDSVLVDIRLMPVIQNLTFPRQDTTVHLHDTTRSRHQPL